MTKEELQSILTLHSAWLRGEAIGKQADLRYADLSSADLSYADLSSADLRYADLSSANLSSANLRSADLRYANLSSADLLVFSFNRHTLYFTFDGKIRIGCHNKGIKTWKKEYKKIGESEKYTAIELTQYKAVIDMCEKLQKKHKPKENL